MASSATVLLLGELTRALAPAVEAAGGRPVWVDSAANEQETPLCVILSSDDASTQLAAWREDPRTVDLPVVALVPHAAERAFRDALVAGADDVVVVHDTSGITRRVAALKDAEKRTVASRGRVAIVDADVTRRRRFGRVLRRGGLDLHFASEMAELGDHKFDVVIVHHSIGADGDATHLVRQHLHNHVLPVVVIADAQDEEHGGRRVERTATVPAKVPAEHLLFVVNELLSSSTVEQRSSPRLLFATLCSFRRAQDMIPSYGVTYNLSRQGLFVRTLDPPPVGEVVWLEIRAPYTVGAVHLRATVRWRNFTGGMTPAGFAVQLLPPRCPPFDLDRYRMQYQHLLDEPQAYGLGSAPQAEPVSGTDRRPRLLVADDEEAVRKTIARAFRDSDIELTFAEDGERAVELFRAKRHDAVLTDIHMPKLSGIQLLQAIRADDKDVPVIITTGLPSIETAVAAVAHGALRYLQKPMTPDVLREAVHEALGMGRLARFRRQAALLAAEARPAGDDIGELDAALSRAIEHLRAHYQPIVAWPARHIVAYEALARTTEPAIPHPGALFDAAERLDRLNEVGRRMRAIAPDPFGDASSQLYVNLHPEDLNDESLYDPSSALAAMAERVVLELTERASLDSIQDLRERCARLRKLGFRIAVDDLGAGYAGLSAFCTLQPDVVKLDMSLVRGVDASRTKQRLVESITAACNDLDIRVICEGVETTEELSTLSALGCELFQGYLFARPGPPFPEVQWPDV